MLRFLVDAWQELSNVSWASRKEVMGFLIVALVVVVIASVFFCFVDFIFIKVINVFLGVIYGA